MTSSLKLFQSVQEFYQTMGIYSAQSNQLLSFNVKKVFFLFSITTTTISIGLFFLFKASTIQEYGSSLGGASADLYSLLDFVISVCQMPNILKLFELFEIFIEKSKLNFINLNE